MKTKNMTLGLIAMLIAALCANGQTVTPLPETNIVEETFGEDSIYVITPEVHYESLLDSLLDNVKDVQQVISAAPLPRYFFMPIVYTDYVVGNEEKDAFKPDYSGEPSLVWIEDEVALRDKMSRMRQYAFFSDPEMVRYNIRTLPSPPKQFMAVVNPEAHTIEILEQAPTNATVMDVLPKVSLINWLHTFTGSLQFSQAYVSPNWYQGGNNNVNMITNLRHDIKLNQKLHPTLLFDTSIQYKLAMNSAPDDTIRGYNISEDLFQINSTFGVKAVKKWYYTVNMMFKTQLFNSYKSNSRDLRSAFLSPGEFNAGIGMTYNTSNKKKTFTLDASISPLSYNYIVCINDRMNKGQFKIDPDKKSSSKYGSSIDCKVSWVITSNIKLTSRLFAFTDYNRFYSDLENTFVFEINKYLTTQLFANFRYDTLTPYTSPNWHKLQVKEILSMGFAYKFSTI